MSIWDEMENDAPEVLADLGREIQFRGQKMLALIDNNPMSEQLGDGGFVFSAGYRVRLFIKSDSALRKAPPKQGEHITMYDRKFSISKVSPRWPSPWFDAYVISATQ